MLLTKIINHFFRKIKLKKAIKKADAERVRTYMKQFVIYMEGEFKVVSKQRLKQLHTAGVFKKGKNFKDILKFVTYSTN